MKVTISLALALSLVSGAALADCNQSSLKGNWQSYSAGWDGKDAFWKRCTFKINGKGEVTDGTCQLSRGTPAAMTGEFKLTDEAACTYTAQLKSPDANRLVQGTLSRDKITGMGVGSFPGGTFIAVMTKI